MWLFCGPTNFNGSTSELLVNISIPSSSEPVSEFFDRLNSLASLQFFGWQEGCVLDGLYDLSKVRPDREIRYTIDLHFAQFFDKQGNLIAEDDFSQPVDGRVYGIEATLPYAVLAQQQPEHPILDMVVDYWRSMQLPDGAIQEASGAYAENIPATSPETTEGTVTTAEGAYTVAYPMAVLSRLPGRSDLAPIAIHQLRIRKARLWKGKDFYLRVREDGTRSFGNWSRGVAWYLLGYARTMIWLDDSQVPDDILDEFKRAAGWVIERQLGNGLWAGFIDSPDVLPDTAGSAGIAAGLALGYTRGYLSSAARDSANMTLNALIPYLTPDGFLRGVSQVNKAGEGLQRSQYRVISQMAMGLMGQLVAALASTSTQPAAGWLDKWS